MKAAGTPPTASPSGLVVVAIVFYQRRLSPLKGCSCAHRVRHGGGESCSQHIKGLVADLGPLAALAPARERLGACREANAALRAGMSRPFETGRRRGRRRRWFGRWWRRGDRAEDLFDAEDPGGDASGCEAESVECNFCDCSP